MPRVRVTIKQTQTATFDTGNLPVNLIRDVLRANEGTFDGNWSLGDVARDDKWVVDEVIVEEVVNAKSK
jgi:hypothetical protein